MTEFTEEQLAAIKKAVETCWPSACGEDVLYKLRPKPKFADDQVVFRPGSNTYHTYKFSRSAQCRALTLDEMGPLPREMYEMINDAMGSAATGLIKRFKEVHNA